MPKAGCKRAHCARSVCVGVAADIDFAGKHQRLFVRKGVADAILTQSVLEVFVNSILFCKIGECDDVLCRDPVRCRHKVVLGHPYAVWVPDVVELDTLFLPFAEHLYYAWA